MIKWFCRWCLHGGNIEIVPPESAMAVAAREHKKAVHEMLNPKKTPNPVLLPAGHSLMDTYSGTDCPGDIVVGEAVGKKRRTKSEKNQAVMDFEGELK